MKPTDQQREIIKLAKTGESFKVSALAGSGKSTSLRMIAKRNPNKKYLYLAFNKLVATEAQAKMPSNVTAKTAHSLAFGQTGYPFANRLTGSIFSAKTHIMSLLEKDIKTLKDSFFMTDAQIFVAVAETYTNFLHTIDEKCEGKHIPPYVWSFSPADKSKQKEWRNAICQAANKVWIEMSSKKSHMPVLHDVYLKLWAMKPKRLPYDAILLDEAQDADPCILSVILGQKHLQRILVGDERQELYGWRGSVNAMQGVDMPELPLTKSWRFGKNIADVANEVLSLTADMRLEGMAESDEVFVGEDRNAICVLSRSNGALIQEAVNCLDENKNVYIVGGTKDAVAYLRAAYSLYRGERAIHPELSHFRTWSELIETAESNLGQMYKPIVNLVKKYGVGVLNVANRLEREILPNGDDADVTLSTVHKFKGQERESVRLLDDFPLLVQDNIFQSEEANVLYVALTRAKKRLIISPFVLFNIGEAKKFFSGEDLHGEGQ